MSEQQIEFVFTSSLTKPNPSNGAQDKGVLDEIAKMIRGRIMSQPTGDGISGMNIERHNVTVKFITEVTCPEAVIKAVEEGVRWASRSVIGAFPLSGDKAVRVIVTTHIPQPTSLVQITAKLPSDLYACPVNFEDENALVLELRTELLQFDGARDAGAGINGVSLTIDTDRADTNMARFHIRKLLDRYARQEESVFMPFVTEPVYIAWDTIPIMK